MTRLRTGLLALIGVPLLLAGCGTEAGSSAGGTSSSSPAEADGDAQGKGGEQVGTPETVDCPDVATEVELPEDFAAPLPEGTVVVHVEERTGGRTVVTGSVPGAETDVLADLQGRYAAEGLTLTEGETEERDAESNFEGPGVVGRWGIRELSECSPEATRIDVVVGPA
jgi:hypothetical protein